MPDGDGWADMPIDVLEGITALELESKSMESEAMEAHSSNNVNVTNNPVEFLHVAINRDIMADSKTSALFEVRAVGTEKASRQFTTFERTQLVS